VLIFSTLHFRGKYNQQRGINKRLLVKLSSHERSLIASSAETCQFATDLLVSSLSGFCCKPPACAAHLPACTLLWLQAAKLDQGSGSASQPLQQNGPVSGEAQGSCCRSGAQSGCLCLLLLQYSCKLKTHEIVGRRSVAAYNVGRCCHLHALLAA
jgi:hypothetical protein